MSDQRIEYLIDRALDDTLTPSERQELQVLREAYPEVEARLSDEKALSKISEQGGSLTFGQDFSSRIMAEIGEETALERKLQAAKAGEFAPFFEARVMQRIREEAEASESFFDVELGEVLSRLFPRIAVPAIAATSFAMVANASAAGPDASVVDGLFGLPTEQPTDISIIIWDE